MKISDLRKEYKYLTLRRKDLKVSPFDQFSTWFKEACSLKIIEPNAMILATTGLNFAPSSRTVLMKEYNDKGICFFSNYESRKGRQISDNPLAAVTFLWKEIERQVQIEGALTKATREEALKYFHSRPRRSQISVWASHQSEEIPSRSFLEKEYEKAEERFLGQEVPVPDYWGGYWLIPNRFEFWQGREDRLHDRFAYTLLNETWVIKRLSP